jgi:predicted ABC-type ATPase
MKTLRLRLVAGPNGAGKSTFTEKLLKKHVNWGVYVNPDEIASTLNGDERMLSSRQSFF